MDPMTAHACTQNQCFTQYKIKIPFYLNWASSKLLLMLEGSNEEQGGWWGAGIALGPFRTPLFLSSPYGSQQWPPSIWDAQHESRADGSPSGFSNSVILSHLLSLASFCSFSLSLFPLIHSITRSPPSFCLFMCTLKHSYNVLLFNSKFVVINHSPAVFFHSLIR